MRWDGSGFEYGMTDRELIGIGIAILIVILLLLAAQYFLCPSVDEMIEQARAIDWSNVTELR